MRKLSRSAYEDTKGLVRAAETLLEVVVMTLLYYGAFRKGYEIEHFVYKGKYVLMGVYGALLYVMFLNSDCTLFGQLHRLDLIIGQVISLFVVNFLTYFQLCLIANTMIAVGPMLLLLLAEIVVAVVLMCGFQLFTILGVKEKPLPKNLMKTPPMKLKDMFRVLFKNDQLLWSALVMLLFNIGTNVVGGGLGMMYVYFDNAYNGTLWMVFGLGFAAVSVIFTLFYPALSKKYGRDKLLYSCGFAIIIGYALMMILGLTVPKIVLFEVLGMTITLRFLMTFFAYTIAGWGSGFYMIMVINMANTVEYNEYRTGKRDEGLIFALRPFTAKMGSALMQGLVSLVYIIAGVLTYTNRLTAIDRNLSTETREMVIADVQANGQNSIKILLVCTCIIPIVFMIAAMLIYKKKYFLNETKMTQMLAEINARKEEEISDEISDEQAELALVEDEIANGDVESEEEKEVLDEIAAASDNSEQIEDNVD